MKKNKGYYITLYIERPNIFFPDVNWGNKTTDVETKCFAGYLHFEDLLKKEAVTDNHSVFSPTMLKVYKNGKLYTELPTTKERALEIINHFLKSQNSCTSNQATTNA